MAARQPPPQRSLTRPILLRPVVKNASSTTGAHRRGGQGRVRAGHRELDDRAQSPGGSGGSGGSGGRL